MPHVSPKDPYVSNSAAWATDETGPQGEEEQQQSSAVDTTCGKGDKRGGQALRSRLLEFQPQFWWTQCDPAPPLLTCPGSFRKG